MPSAISSKPHTTFSPATGSVAGPQQSSFLHFAQAMEEAQASPAVEGSGQNNVGRNGNVESVEKPNTTATADGRGNAAQAAETTRGDAILEGMRKVRGAFDQQIARVNGETVPNDVTSASNLIAAQAEVAKMTLMIDLASKLAGKFTQTTDSLLKG